MAAPRASLPLAVAALGLALAAAPAVSHGTAARGSGPLIEQVMALSPHRHIYAADLDRDWGVAVGAMGTILVTSDGGLNWRDVSTQGELALLAVRVVAGQAIAVGQMGAVLLGSADQWRQVDSGTDERLLGVGLNAQGLAVAVGAFGTVILSVDGGGSWRPVDIDWVELVDTDYEPHIYDVHVDTTGRITMVGEFGIVMRSDDGGDHWQLLRSGEASLFSLHVAGDTVYAAGQDGTVVRYAGADWKLLDTGVGANLLGIASGPARQELLVPGMRSVLYSGDGGDTWKELPHGDFSRGWYGDAVWSSRAGGFLLMGHGGRIKTIRGVD